MDDRRSVLVLADEEAAPDFIWAHFRNGGHEPHAASICISTKFGKPCVFQTYPLLDWDWLGTKDTQNVENHIKVLAAANKIFKELVRNSLFDVKAVENLISTVIRDHALDIVLADPESVTIDELNDIWAAVHSIETP